ncbi:hypothetical protein J5N97_017948 [Dioscorea zingiberensis]|uniref:J domain-containing protein n=1 Tax=Dioscorea zingiberensis TaxID=325984 RepID=A0A9D5CP52_9LILI|nr:hypothetical protein J5N97_017948 [Dioscorea zingiberensis]
MLWDEFEFFESETEDEDDCAAGGGGGQGSPFDFDFDFDFLSSLSKPKDYYRILEVDFDASDDAIRSNYIRLALKWHPDKRKDEDTATSRFQEINEAYKVLSDPVKRREYDAKGIMYIQDNNITNYLSRYKGLILTCNGLGTRYSLW